MSLIIADATIIDAVANQPIEGKSIWIENGRIKAIGTRDELAAARGTKVIDARGKYVIPGLMDANVHLLLDIRMEVLVRYEGRYEDLIAEAAQIGLKNGLTTVFDSWGPLRALQGVRDKINAGKLPGSRIFCAGNIVGLDGPISLDFMPKPLEVASGALAKRINATWVGNVGPDLMWLRPDQVAEEIRSYIGRGVDFLKYASSDHRLGPGAFLAFSERVQRVIVDEAHRAGITAQSHTTSVESLRIALEAGCDLIQHGNITGPIAIPQETLELFVKNDTACAVLSWTKRRFDWMMEHGGDFVRTFLTTSYENDLNLIKSGATLLLSTDAGVKAPESSSDPMMAGIKLWTDEVDENLGRFGEGHFFWLRAMEEKGMAPMELLRAATRNIAVAYGKDRDLGTLEPGKLADMLILDKNPLQSVENYRSIHAVIKDGTVVDRDALPVNPVLTKPLAPPLEEEASYGRYANTSRQPLCC